MNSPKKPVVGKNFSRYKKDLGPRKNERIRASEVLLIASDGRQLGIMPTAKALSLARAESLDLVEVAASAQPPVCRILNFGKYLYEIGKKQKGSKSNVNKLKEIKLHSGTEENDFITKLRHAEDFLNRGFKLKISLMFRGREMEHKEFGFNMVSRAIKELQQIGAPDASPVLVGRNVSVTLSPLPVQHRKLKFNVAKVENKTGNPSFANTLPLA